MVLKLLDRDREEALRTSTRTLTFPDGIAREVTAYRLIWRWFDNLNAYEFAPNTSVILRDAISHATRSDISLGDALGAVVQSYVTSIEQSGGDVTDDNLDAVIAAKAMMVRGQNQS